MKSRKAPIVTTIVTTVVIVFMLLMGLELSADHSYASGPLQTIPPLAPKNASYLPAIVVSQRNGQATPNTPTTFTPTTSSTPTTLTPTTLTPTTLTPTTAPTTSTPKTPMTLTPTTTPTTLTPTTPTPTTAATATPTATGVVDPSSDQRRVNVPLITVNGVAPVDDASWKASTIFWLGTNELQLPGQNYADVRIGYSTRGLHVRMTVVDYYLWFNEAAGANEDLRKWDTAAIAFHTAPNGATTQATTPQTQSYLFMAMTRSWVNPGNPTQYRRDARGNGTTWDFSYSPAWQDTYGGVWSQYPGFNSNSGTRDFGGDVIIDLPWAALGRTAPPPAGEMWGMSVAIYDRDTAAESGVLPVQKWPEAATIDNPSTWGILHFGERASAALELEADGETMIRALSLSPTISDDTVQDAWIGGGGSCSGGHEGGNETNHGTDTSLFVASQVLVADFPCFSRAYLRFALDAIPPGKTIVSATVTLAHWGNAGDRATSSHIHLYTIRDPWDQMTIHWNNAPLAQENISSAWIAPHTTPVGVIGVPNSWDVTLGLKNAYQAGIPLNIALYSSDTGFDSSKYFGSSNAYDQYIVNRPRLTVWWVD